MDEAAAGAPAWPVPAARPVRRWALRAGAVLGFAAAAWLFGCSTAAAETPAGSVPGCASGVLDSVHDSAVGPASSAIDAGDGDGGNGASASPVEATTGGQDTVVPPVVTSTLSAADAESTAQIADLVTHRIAPATPSAPADAHDAPPPAVDGDDAAHGTAPVVDALAGNAAAATIARVTPGRPAFESAMAQVRHAAESADLRTLPTVSLIAPVTESIRPVVDIVGAVMTLTPVTDIVAPATDALADALAGAHDAVGVDLVPRPALPDRPSTGGVHGDDVRVTGGSAEAVEGDRRGSAPVPARFPALTSGAHRVVAVHVSAAAAPPMVVRADVGHDVVDSLAGPQRDRPPRLPAPATVVVVGSGVGSATNGGYDDAAWAPASSPSRHDVAAIVRGSERPAVLDHARDPGFSPD